jgi:hypothetical protein
VTRLEKARQMKPRMTDEEIMKYCPWRFFGWPQKTCYEPGVEQEETYEQWMERVCFPCWNKPYEEVS